MEREGLLLQQIPDEDNQKGRYDVSKASKEMKRNIKKIRKKRKSLSFERRDTAEEQYQRYKGYWTFLLGPCEISWHQSHCYLVGMPTSRTSGPRDCLSASWDAKWTLAYP